MMTDLFQKAQGAIATRLGALTEFQYTPVFIDRPRKYFVDTLAPDGVTVIPAGTVIDTPTIHAQIEAALGGFMTKGGKCGTSIIVFNPSLNDRDHLSNAPSERLNFIVRVLENVFLNNGPTGTTYSAELLAHSVKRLLHQWAPCAGLKLYPVEANAIQPIIMDEEKEPSTLCYDVHLYSNLVGTKDDRVARPDLRMVRDVSPEEGHWVGDFDIKCATADAEIWFTRDGSFPISTNSAAEHYTPELAPYHINDGDFISCCAYKAGMSPSDVVERLFQN